MLRIRLTWLGVLLALACLQGAFLTTMATSGDVSFLTYNVGFFSPSPQMIATHDIRRAAVLQSIATDSVWKSTDVVCIQEARLTQSDFFPISSALRQAGFVHQHSFLDYFNSSDNRAACGNADAINAFVECSASSRAAECHIPALSSLLAMRSICITLSCQQEYESLTQQCAECILDHRQPSNIIENITANAERCSLANESSYRPTFGLILASRRPLSNLESVPFKRGTSFLIPGYLKGDVDGVGSVYCTYQTPNLEAIRQFGVTAPPEGGYETFGAGNLNETHRLIAAMSRGPSILLGDLNNGPVNATANLRSSNPMSFQAYQDAGLLSGAILAGRYECTYCARSNPLLVNGLSSNDELLDFVLLTSHFHSNVIEGERVFLKNISGTGFPMSDHYGVRVVINTGTEYQVQLSRWERRFATWEAAYQRWERGQCQASP